LRTLQHLVLDEADRILSLDFEEDIDKILKASARACAFAGFGGSRICSI
jgi:superfamily II DNA/RNA helicase